MLCRETAAIEVPRAKAALASAEIPDGHRWDAPPKARFAPHPPLEGAVYCELVSEVQKLGADSGRVMDDSGIVKRCFPHEFGRKLYPPPRGVTPPSGYKSL